MAVGARQSFHFLDEMPGFMEIKELFVSLVIRFWIT